VVGTYDGTTLALYANGVAAGNKAASAGLGISLDSIVLGGPALQGSLDEVAVYGHALTVSQVQAHYTVELTVPATSTPTLTATAGRTGTRIPSRTRTPTETSTPTTSPTSTSTATAGMTPQSSTDATGQIETLSTTGSIVTTGAFFQSLGTNGRTCATCHIQSEGWSITPAQA
jgi:hypothetical protein